MNIEIPKMNLVVRTPVMKAIPISAVNLFQGGGHEYGRFKIFPNEEAGNNA